MAIALPIVASVLASSAEPMTTPARMLQIRAGASGERDDSRGEPIGNVPRVCSARR